MRGDLGKQAVRGQAGRRVRDQVLDDRVGVAGAGARLAATRWGYVHRPSQSGGGAHLDLQ
jgi:hypothetical protein